MEVFVYYNLHRKCLSVKAKSGPFKNRVIAHAQGILLKNAKFKVSEAGRQRVIREKAKNVHAGVAGQLVDIALKGPLLCPKACVTSSPVEARTRPGFQTTSIAKGHVTYNPYLYDSFVDVQTNEKVSEAQLVLICGRRISAYGPK